MVCSQVPTIPDDLPILESPHNDATTSSPHLRVRRSAGPRQPAKQYHVSNP